MYKPRGQWHTFWNAGDEPCRILEIISPVRLRACSSPSSPLVVGRRPRPETRFGPLCERYGLDMQPDTVPELIERFGLRFPGAS